MFVGKRGRKCCKSTRKRIFIFIKVKRRLLTFQEKKNLFPVEGNRGSCLPGHQSNRLTGSSWTDATNVCVFFAIGIIGNVSPEGKIVNMGVSTAQLMSEAQECFFQKVVKIVFLA